MLRRRLSLLILTVGWIAGCTQHPANSTQARKAEITPGEIGSRLPDFSVRDLQGNSLSSSDLRGKVVLVDFWATWCQPCKKEMPGYQKLANNYRARGLVVVGFKFDNMRDTEDPLRFAKRLGVHYPLVVATGELQQRFGGIAGLPTTMLYDRQGILRMKVIGFEYTDTIESALKPLL